MKLAPHWPWQRKSFFYLVLAALSVAWTGVTFSELPKLPDFLRVSFCTIALVFYVYGLDDWLDRQAKNLIGKEFILILLAGVLSVLIGFWFLNELSGWACVLVLTSGTLYTLQFAFFGKSFRLKAFLILKNLLIGVGWGALIVLGSGKWDWQVNFFASLFFTLQVIIGSIIRDLDDLQEDRATGVKTIPLFFARGQTFLILHGLNFLALGGLVFASLQVPNENSLWLIWAVAVLYRFFLLELMRKEGGSRVHFQQFNLATCGLIFILRLVQQWLF